jgi:hypothetical protein
MSELHVQWKDAEQAGVVFANVVRPWCKEQWAAGRQLAVSIRELEDARSLQQLRYYWGPMLGEISEQAQINGQKYAKDAWHELGKRQFLPRRIAKTRVAGRARPVVSVSLGSTKGLSVKKMSEYIEKFQAWVTTDLGVVFSERRWQDYQGQA